MTNETETSFCDGIYAHQCHEQHRREWTLEPARVSSADGPNHIRLVGRRGGMEPVLCMSGEFFPHTNYYSDEDCKAVRAYLARKEK